MGMTFLSYFGNYAAVPQTFFSCFGLRRFFAIELARNVWCRHTVPFCKELGSDNLTQKCRLGGWLAGKLSARVLPIALSFLCASLHSSTTLRLAVAESTIFSFVVIANLIWLTLLGRLDSLRSKQLT